MGSDISTHILTKRMTDWSREQSQVQHYFNSHPHEEDDIRQRTCEVVWKYFNSHPHEEDDVQHLLSNDVLHDISTHILTKRMTCSYSPSRILESISTHILTKRMTAILNKNNLFKIAYYINNKHFISIVDIFFHFHIHF